jgi:hypothetical protein
MGPWMPRDGDEAHAPGLRSHPGVSADFLCAAGVFAASDNSGPRRSRYAAVRTGAGGALELPHRNEGIAPPDGAGVNWIITDSFLMGGDYCILPCGVLKVMSGGGAWRLIPNPCACSSTRGAGCWSRTVSSRHGAACKRPWTLSTVVARKGTFPIHRTRNCVRHIAKSSRACCASRLASSRTRSRLRLQWNGGLRARARRRQQSVLF